MPGVEARVAAGAARKPDATDFGIQTKGFFSGAGSSNCTYGGCSPPRASSANTSRSGTISVEPHSGQVFVMAVPPGVGIRLQGCSIIFQRAHAD
jgi:hypothetical protein